MEPLTRERRREMTRQHLLDAAVLVFARKGFNGATLDEVAATAGFTKGAVYSNFSSKADLFVALLDERFDRQMVSLEEELAEGPLAEPDQVPRMRELILRNMDDDDWAVLYLEFLVYALRNEDARAKLVTTVRKARAATEHLIVQEHERRGVSPQLPVPEVAVISLALFNGISVDRLIDPDAFPPETLDVALEFMWRAMGIEDETPASEGDG